MEEETGKTIPRRAPLTDRECKTFKPADKPYRKYDAKGLYMQISPSGAKAWRYKYTHNGKEKVLALGLYPEIGLGEARERTLAARKIVQAGLDPSFEKKVAKKRAVLNAQNSFEAIAREWYQNNRARWSSQKHAENILHRLEKDIFPVIGARPIADIMPPEVLDNVRLVEKRGAQDVARRLLQYIHLIFAYAIATSRAQRNPAAEIKGALKPAKHGHFACIEPKEIPTLLDKIARNEARLYPQTKTALVVIMHVFVRVNELIEAKWSEFDLDDRQEWHIPAERMKMRRHHIVPLSRQVVRLLKQHKEHQCINSFDWVFPSIARPAKHMSNATLLGALKSMGYNGKMTVHGFRALATTTMKEHLEVSHEIIDRQLSHAQKSRSDASYDRSKYLIQRVEMMQRWSDYLEKLNKAHLQHG